MKSAQTLSYQPRLGRFVAAFRRNILAHSLVIIGLAFLASGVFAQPGGKGSPEQMVERRIQHLTKTLALTPDQVSKIKPILENNAKEFAKIREEKKGDRKAMMLAAQERMESNDKEISALLTPEQQTKFAAQRDKMKAKMKERIEKRKANK
jgi:Spy/CpxP family protein refolding chaperone